MAQPDGVQGSLMWVQRLVGTQPDLIRLQGRPSIHWRSPVRRDDMAEYGGAAALKTLDLPHLRASWRDFWPGTPVLWDALGLAGDVPVLVDAKAALRDVGTGDTLTGEPQRALLASRLRKLGQSLGATNPSAWEHRGFHLTGKLAFLDFLHHHGTAAQLVHVCFLDSSGNGSESDPNAWRTEISAAYRDLGLPDQHRLAPFIHIQCVDVARLC